MPLFEIPNRPGSQVDSKIVKSASKVKKKASSIRAGNNISKLIAEAKLSVDRNLRGYEKESLVIRDYQTLESYIDKSIQNGVIAIDTETNGLDPISDDIVGVCIYTPNEKTAYVPINHVNYITLEHIPNQLRREDVAKCLMKLKETNTRIIMFNAPFDIRVIKNQLGVRLVCYWDCYIAARLLNENEPKGTNNLKSLHNKYVLDGKVDAFRFDDLFHNIKFSLVPIDTAYLYAAHDAKITYELYEFQHKYLYQDNPKEDLRQIYSTFMKIEMPVVDVVVEMEDIGVSFDKELAGKLSIKYHKELDEKLDTFYKELSKYSGEIDAYKKSNPNCKLDDPINIASPKQLQVLLYDILKIPSVDRKDPRGTGEEILSKIDHPLAQLVLDYREFAKLISTYIDKLPLCVNPKDNRLHCNFDSYGADTGRFSSKNPKLNWALA